MNTSMSTTSGRSARATSTAPWPSLAVETSYSSWSVWASASRASSSSSATRTRGLAPGSGWAVLGDYIHLLAAAVWLGGLLLLPLLAWQLRQAGAADSRLHLPALARRLSAAAKCAS